MFGENATTVEPKVRRTTFVAATVGDVRFCELSIVVAARMVIGDRNELDRQEAREVRGVREVAVIDRRKCAEQDILVVYRLAGRVAESGSDNCSLSPQVQENVARKQERSGYIGSRLQQCGQHAVQVVNVSLNVRAPDRIARNLDF